MATDHGTRMLQHLRHGADVLPDDAPGAKAEADRLATVSLAGSVVAGHDVAEVSTPFGYLFDDLADAFPQHHLPTGDPAGMTARLTALGTAMVEQAPADPAGNSVIPAVYTYWGQFIDHDITANTDRKTLFSDVAVEVVEPRTPADVTTGLRNLRQPALNLDSVYGDGPQGASAALYDGPALRVGRVALTTDAGDPVPGQRVTPEGDDSHDLFRDGTTAVIGDGRNDENLVVAQFHVAFLRFHNAVLEWVRVNEPHLIGRALFRRVRDLVRFHYQWLVVHDYLKTVTATGTVDQILLGGNRVFRPRHDTYMPLEFSVAAYRFGHSMVRGAYDFNLNFGRNPDGTALLPTAPFGLLFAFTGGARPAPFNGGGTTTLPFNWVIDWNRFVHKGDGDATHFARRIDTRLVPPLTQMVNQVTPDDEAQLPDLLQAVLRHLAVRNLLRGYSLAIPTGQAVAAALGVPALTTAELQAGNGDELNRALTDGGFLEATPLWFYLLKEAEVKSNGNALGPAGSRIVAETLIGQIRADEGSYLHRGWTPARGVRFPDGGLIVSISDLFRFAGVLPA
ncbi:hypothetical protein KIH74_21400 [Kineosporia sp. J2-2]|uniref:Animal haem peroxidase n=1 Tax=Kineosporia corallincola TaxID=2835133 RepID=A0ABS5TN73_9ACTN|nr:heme peroxidase family protein [Kineosporia corallincola]MBT0771508.1 hypothetical protein [Kineosporia corallincola]